MGLAVTQTNVSHLEANSARKNCSQLHCPLNEPLHLGATTKSQDGRELRLKVH